METALVFVFGLVWGSFANAALWRLAKKKNILRERSECVHCHRKLGFFDLIPVLSFLLLRGRCRYCRRKISWQYPVVEFIFGLAILFIYRYSGGLAEAIFLAGIFLVTFLIFVYDLKFLIIPDVLVVLGLVWILLGGFWLAPPLAPDAVWIALAVFLFFFLMHKFSRGRWVGGGDAKLGFLLGLWLGWPLGILGLFAAYIMGAITGVGLMAFKKVTLKSQIPFGPFLIAGAWIVFLWGEYILKWYGEIPL